MDGPTYGSDVLLATLRQRLANERRTPLQLATFLAGVAFELERSEGREVLAIHLEVQAARVASEFARLTDWQERCTG